MIDLDFKEDWNEFLRREMPRLGLSHNPTLPAEDNTLRYLKARRRTPRQACRIVHEAQELEIPPAHRADYETLKKLMQDGKDLTPYLSRDMQRNQADKNDGLLNAWGIQHLHYRPEGTCEVLFVKLTDSDAFVLKSLPHGRGHPETWVDTSLLAILHNNWPEVAGGRVAGVAGEDLSSSQRVALRKDNANFATEMPDGEVYLGDGGLMASGDCMFDIQESDWISGILDYWQRFTVAKEATIRTVFGVPLPGELSVKLRGIGPEGCLLYEPGSKRLLLLRATR